MSHIYEPKNPEGHMYSSKEYTKWMANVWKKNIENQSKINKEICIAEINSGIYSDN